MSEPSIDVGVGKLFESLGRLLKVKALKAQQDGARAFAKHDLQQMRHHRGRVEAFLEAAGLAGELADRWNGAGDSASRPASVPDSPP
jgi:hypothetical protein